MTALAVIVSALVGLWSISTSEAAVTDSVVSVSDGKLSFAAGNGLSNEVTITVGDSTIEVRDGADRLAAGDGCQIVEIGEATCELIGTSSIAVMAKNLADHVRVLGSLPSVIEGGSGNDLIQGGTGDDSLIGGAGTDTVSYGDSDSGVTVKLGSALPQAVTDTETDALAGIENLIGSSHDDDLTGSNAANSLVGGEGNDTIRPRDGPDSIVGGEGFDAVLYLERSAAVHVSLDGEANDGEPTESDNVAADIEEIFGGSGADVLKGTIGNQRLVGRGGDDWIDGGAGDDELVGGAGADTASYESATAAVLVRVGKTQPQDTAGAGIDDLSGIENLEGSEFADELIGSNLDNVLRGRSGDDVIRPRLGSDQVQGGDGNDTVSYAEHQAPVAASLSGVLVGGDFEGQDAIDSSTENLIGGQGDDVLIGNGGENSIEGRAGNDFLSGAAGDDVLSGGAGRDDVEGGSGEDDVSGGPGNDYLAVRDQQADSAQCGGGRDTVYLDQGLDVVACEIKTEVEPPDTEITGVSEDGEIAGPFVEIAFSASVEGATFECSFGVEEPAESDFESCFSPFVPENGWSAGENLVFVRAVKNALRDPTPAVRRFSLDAEAPSVEWIQYPAALLAGGTARFEFTLDDEQGIAECATDEEAFTACESPVSIDGLAAGTHVFAVKTTDAAGNSAVHVGEPFEVVEPGDVIQFPNGFPDALTWSSDPVEVETPIENLAITCFVGPIVDGELGETSECSVPFSVPSWYEEGMYRATFEARTDDGSVVGSGKSADFAFDLTSPTVKIDNPTESRIPVVDGHHSFEFSSADDDVSRFLCSTNRGEPEECESPFEVELELCANEFRVTAVDHAGLESDATDLIAHDPETEDLNTVVSCLSPTTDDGSPTFFSVFSALLEPLDMYSVVLGSIDPGGTSFECSMNGRPWSDCGASNVRSLEVPGENELRARVKFDGNVDSTPASVSWSSQREMYPPWIYVESPEPNAALYGPPSITFFKSEPLVDVFCRVDGGSWEACASPYKPAGGLARGAHEIELQPRLGSLVGDSAVFAFQIAASTVAPFISSGPGNGDRVDAGEVRFGFSTLAPMTFECSFDSSSFVPCVSPATMPANGPASRTFAVRSIDAFGNPSNAVRRTYTTADTGSESQDALEVFVTDGPADGSIVHSRAVSYAFHSNRHDIQFDCAFDGLPAEPCESPVDLTELVDGSHTFEVTASSESGLWTPAAVTRSFSVDASQNYSPDVQVTQVDYSDESVKSTFEGDSVEMVFTSTAADATFECRINFDAWFACGSPYRLSLADPAPVWESSRYFEVRSVSQGAAGMPVGNWYYVRERDQYWIDIGYRSGDSDYGQLESGSTITGAPLEVRATAVNGLGDQLPLSTLCKVDDQPEVLCTALEAPTSYGLGRHEITARVPASSGVKPISRTASFVVEDQSESVLAPEITFAPDRAVPASGSAAFGFTAENADGFECRLDDAEFETCSSPFSAPLLQSGGHTFDVRSAKGHAVSQSISTPFEVAREGSATNYEDQVERGPTGADALTAQATDALKERIFVALDQDDQSAQMSGAQNFAASGGEPVPTIGDAKEALTRIGAWPSKVAFMNRLDFYPANSDIGLEVNFHGSFKPVDGGPIEARSGTFTEHLFEPYRTESGQLDDPPWTYSQSVVGWLDEPGNMLLTGRDLTWWSGTECETANLSCWGGTRTRTFSSGVKRCLAVAGGLVVGDYRSSAMGESGFGMLGEVRGEIEVLSENEYTCIVETPGQASRLEQAVFKTVREVAEEEKSVFDGYYVGSFFGRCESDWVCHGFNVDLDNLNREMAAKFCESDPSFCSLLDELANVLDAFGQQDVQAADPVDPYSGNFALTKTDLVAASPGPKVSATRSYNSRDKRVGPFGRGWSFEGTHSAAMLSTGAVRVAKPDGRTFTFTRSPSGAFVAPPGHAESLSTVQNGSEEILILRDPEMRQTTRFDDSGRVVDVTDEVGNKVTYSYSGSRLDRLTGSSGEWIEFAYSGDGLVSSATDSSGRTTHYDYASGSLVGVTNPEGGRISYEYTDEGLLRSATDPDTRRPFENTYDPIGRVETQLTAEGQVWSFDYDESGTRLTDSDGRVTTYRFDQFGDVSSLKGPETADSSFVRDRQGNVLTERRADGTQLSYTYDARGNMTTEVDAKGNVTSYVYDESDNLESTTDALGRTTNYEYDEENNLVEENRPDGSSVAYEYARPGLVSRVTDELGIGTDFEYDDIGRLERTEDASGRATLREYDEFGHLAATTTPGGARTEFEHLPMGDIVQERDPEGGVTSYDYDEAGNLLSVTDALGNELSTEFDGAGRPVHERRNGRLLTTRSFDERGLATAESDSRGGVEKTIYDPKGRVVRSIDPESASTAYEHDKLGRVTAQTNARGQTTHFSYDANGNLLTVTEPGGGVTSYEYDAADRMVLKRDANGSATSYEYDAADRLLRVTQPLGITIENEYDARGGLIAQEVSGERTSYLRDDLGRVTRTTLADGSFSTFAYNAAGKLAQATDSEGRNVTFTYDAVGRVLQTTDALGKMTSYERDAAGNVVAETNTAGRTEYTYDDASRPASIATPSGLTHRFTHDDEGNLIRREVDRQTPNGSAKRLLTEQRYFDYASKLIRQITRNGKGEVVSSFTYRYDANGNPTLRRTMRGEERYQYDHLDRLTRTDFADGTADLYTYDKLGNRTSKDGEPYTYDAANKLLTAPGGRSFTYDPQGRLIAETSPEGQSTYAYNSLGKLTSKTPAGEDEIAFTYDALGRVVSETQGELARTHSYSVGDSPTSSSTRLASTELAASRTTHRTYGPAGLAEEASPLGDATVPITDEHGTITETLSKAGDLTEPPETDLFGVLIDPAAEPSSEDRYAQLGDRPLDYLGAHGRAGVLGDAQMHMGARIYDPGLGRFLSRDPYLGDHDAPQSQNAYAYALGSPGLFYDLDGRYAIPSPYPVPFPVPCMTPECQAANEDWVDAIGDLVSNEVTWWSNRAHEAWDWIAKSESDSASTGSNVAKCTKCDGTTGNGGGNRRSTPGSNKATSPIWSSLKTHRKEIRTNGKTGKRKRFYTWDYTHKDIEEFDRFGRHLGSLDPVTGARTKGPVKGRTITP